MVQLNNGHTSHRENTTIWSHILFRVGLTIVKLVYLLYHFHNQKKNKEDIPQSQAGYIRNRGKKKRNVFKENQEESQFSETKREKVAIKGIGNLSRNFTPIF